MKINIIGVSLSLECDRAGVGRAPNHLRERGLMGVIRRNRYKVFDLGNLHVPPVDKADKSVRGNSMKYLDAIVEVNTNLAELVYDILRGGAFLLVISGDHLLGLGSALGVGKCYDDFGIIWLDAHRGINTGETSPSGNIRGMPLSTLMGMGDEGLVNIYVPGSKVNLQNVFLVGTRSSDGGEWDLIEREKLSVCMMETTRLKGISFVTEGVKRKLKEQKIHNAHFSIDMNSISPRLAPSTETCAYEGLMSDELDNFVDHMLSTNLVKPMDLIELSSELGVNERTTSLCPQIIDCTTARL